MSKLLPRLVSDKSIIMFMKNICRLKVIKSSLACTFIISRPEFIVVVNVNITSLDGLHVRMCVPVTMRSSPMLCVCVSVQGMVLLFCNITLFVGNKVEFFVLDMERI